MLCRYGPPLCLLFVGTHLASLPTPLMKPCMTDRTANGMRNLHCIQAQHHGMQRELQETRAELTSQRSRAEQLEAQVAELSEAARCWQQRYAAESAVRRRVRTARSA